MDTQVEPVEMLPKWAVALDVLACSLFLLGAWALVTGNGPHGQVAGVRVSLTSGWRLLVAAAICTGLRHLLVRRPTLARRLQPVWLAVGRPEWPCVYPPSLPVRPRQLRRGLAIARANWPRAAAGPILVIVLFCVPLFAGLGGTDFENDEAGYSYSIETMLRTGDWLTPQSITGNGMPLDKPPLKCWIVAATLRLGLLPDNEFGLRFWDAVFGSVAFLYVFAIGRKIGGPLCGFVAVLTLFLHEPLVFQHGLRTNNMEAPLMLCYSGGVYHFLAWLDGPVGSRKHAIAVAVYFVLGFMTKFVAAIFLPMVLAAAIVLGGDFPRFWRGRRAWLAAAGVALALIAPWFAYESFHLGAAFWRMLFGEAVVTRFTSYLDPAHVQPWHYYFVAVSDELRDSQTAPLVRAGLALLLLRALRGRREATVLLVWFALPIGLMSMGTSKLYHYTYPFLPALALAAGYACAAGLALGLSLTAPAGRVPRSAVPPPWRRALLAVAFVALAIAGATYVFGPLQITLGGRLLENWTVLRPALVGMLALALAGRVAAAARVATVVVLLFVLPAPFLYHRELKQLSLERHQMRTARDCMRPLAARRPGGVGPGMWVDHEALIHPLYYYFRDLGPWHKQEPPSDALIAAHLYTPNQQRPVLLSSARFRQFTDGAAGSTPAAPVGVLRLDNGILLLPGPYRSCATEQYAPGR